MVLFNIYHHSIGEYREQASHIRPVWKLQDAFYQHRDQAVTSSYRFFFHVNQKNTYKNLNSNFISCQNQPESRTTVSLQTQLIEGKCGNKNLRHCELKAVLTTDTGMCHRPLISSSSYHTSVSRQPSPSASSSSSVLPTKAAPGETDHRPGMWEKPFLFFYPLSPPLIYLLFLRLCFFILNKITCVTSPDPAIQSASFKQPPAFCPPGPGRELFINLLHYLTECSVHPNFRKGPQLVHHRYATSKMAVMLVSAA